MRVPPIQVEIMSNPILSKAVLRTKLLAHRQAIADEVREQWNASIRGRLLAWSEEYPVQTLGVFWPIRGEPDLRPAYENLVARNVRLALPIVTGKDAPLVFVNWSPGDPMEKDAFGVSVPLTRMTVSPDALLVPCVGFNADCFRIGYGGGMFDRTLEASPRPVTLGVGYACGLSDFEADPHDVALDAVLTDSAVIRRK
jgi:5,10-methenyltetrahydrofolate synthetase